MSYGGKQPIRTFKYSRRLQHLKPGTTRVLKLHGKRVKVALDKTGRELTVLDAHKSVVNEIQNADTLQVRKNNSVTAVNKLPAVPNLPAAATSATPTKPTKPKKPKKPKTSPSDTDMATAVKKLEDEKSPPPPAAVATSPSSSPAPSKKLLTEPWILTEKDRKAALKVPVPPKGPVAPTFTPFIDWDAVPESAKISDIVYEDYPTSSAPKGMLALLRDGFKLNRMYQKQKPTNVLIVGPPGTGKSTLIRKFAEDTGLPYWQVIGQDGLTAEDLLGRAHIKDGRDVWTDGVIPKAARIGGILHIDEPNVLPASVMMRLNELMDAKRQLNMQDLNGEIIKAHPDLYIVFTMNPSNYEGVNPLPPPVLNRFKQVWLPFPPEDVEYRILEGQLRAIGVQPKDFQVKGKQISGTLAQDIKDFTDMIRGLRADQNLPWHPSMRQTIDFTLARKQGYNFQTAFRQTVGDSYIALDESTYAPLMDETLNSKNRLN